MTVFIIDHTYWPLHTFWLTGDGLCTADLCSAPPYCCYTYMCPLCSPAVEPPNTTCLRALHAPSSCSGSHTRQTLAARSKICAHSRLGGRECRYFDWWMGKFVWVSAVFWVQTTKERRKVRLEGSRPLRRLRGPRVAAHNLLTARDACWRHASPRTAEGRSIDSGVSSQHKLLFLYKPAAEVERKEIAGQEWNVKFQKRKNQLEK